MREGPCTLAASAAVKKAPWKRETRQSSSENPDSEGLGGRKGKNFGKGGSLGRMGTSRWESSGVRKKNGGGRGAYDLMSSGIYQNSIKTYENKTNRLMVFKKHSEKPAPETCNGPEGGFSLQKNAEPGNQ